MCRKLCHFIWGTWWFHRSKDFEAMKAEKSAIRPWLTCPYHEHTLVDLPSSVQTGDFFWPKWNLDLRFFGSGTFAGVVSRSGIVSFCSFKWWFILWWANSTTRNIMDTLKNPHKIPKTRKTCPPDKTMISTAPA